MTAPDRVTVILDPYALAIVLHLADRQAAWDRAFAYRRGSDDARIVIGEWAVDSVLDDLAEVVDISRVYDRRTLERRDGGR